VAVRDIAAEIGSTIVPSGAVAIWWLGQFSFVIKGQRRTLAFDLYLSDYPGNVTRSYSPLIRPDELAGLDLVFCTHDHLDHLDPWTLKPLAETAPTAVFVTPEACTPRAKEVLPSGRVIGSRADEPLQIKDVQIWPIPAAHDRLEDAENGHSFQGYVVRLDGVTICHTGDTVMYDGLIERLRERPVDVLLAPINGLDYFRTRRDIVGNLSCREAAELAAAAGVKLLIPAHWDLFAGNAENPGHLFEYLARFHPEQPCHYMARGERFIYHPCRAGG
jgi:L-ascorbate metabolism protein UlaG (beta-lactamase superfamily)